MPTIYASSNPTRATRFAVVGENHPLRGVRHVGLLEEECDLCYNEPASVFQMGPPLQAGQHGGRPGTMPAHVVGMLDGMTKQERDEIEGWLDLVRTQAPLHDHYVAHPASELQRDAVSGAVMYRAFSCAGFVERCYAEGPGIELVTGESSMPEADVFLVEDIWSHMLRRLPAATRTRMMARYGLRGDGPWKLLLPGHVLHALNQARASLPYQPGPDDWAF